MAPSFMIADHTIVVQRRLRARMAESLVFFDQLPVCGELVLSLYRKENQSLATGIHGYWYCNVINARILITLKNEDQIDPVLTEEINALVAENFQKMNQGIGMLWRPRGKRSSAPKHLFQQTKKHNVYCGKIFKPDCIEEATVRAEPYTSPSGPLSLIRFFDQFVDNLRKQIREDPSVRESALTSFSEYAKDFYGRELRITMKSAYQVDLGFLSDEAQNPIDHVLDQPQGDA